MPGGTLNTVNLPKYASMDLHKCRLCTCLRLEVLLSTLNTLSDTHFELLPVTVTLEKTETRLKGDSKEEFPRRYIMLFCDHTSLKLSAAESLVCDWCHSCERNPCFYPSSLLSPSNQLSATTSWFTLPSVQRATVPVIHWSFGIRGNTAPLHQGKP